MYETYEEITGCCFTSDVWESMAASPSFVQGHPAQWTCHLPFAGLIPSEPDSAFNCSSVGAPGCGEWLGAFFTRPAFPKIGNHLNSFRKKASMSLEDAHPLIHSGSGALLSWADVLVAWVALRWGFIWVTGTCHWPPCHHARLVNCWWAFSSLSKAAAIF